MKNGIYELKKSIGCLRGPPWRSVPTPFKKNQLDSSSQNIDNSIYPLHQEDIKRKNPNEISFNSEINLSLAAKFNSVKDKEDNFWNIINLSNPIRSQSALKKISGFLNKDDFNCNFNLTLSEEWYRNMEESVIQNNKNNLINRDIKNNVWIDVFKSSLNLNKQKNMLEN